jgi:hypothetical protein
MVRLPIIWAVFISALRCEVVLALVSAEWLASSYATCRLMVPISVACRVAGHTEATFRAAAYRAIQSLSSGRVEGAAFLAEQCQIIKEAYRAERVPLASAQITVNRFCRITGSKEGRRRFAKNARYQSRLPRARGGRRSCRGP